MIKYFFRQYWRYIAMALAFASFSFLINSCQVNAEELNQSYTLNYDVTDTNTQHTIYNNNNGLLPNRRVYVAFNILIYKASTNTSFMVPPLRDVQVVASNNIYMCETNTFPIEYNFEDSYKGFYYNVICDVTTGSSGIKQIIATNDSYQSNSVRFVTSQYMTIRDNLQETINQTLTNASLAQQNILNTINTNIDNETLAIRQLMSGLNATLVTCVDNNTQYILNAINNQTTTITNIIQQMIEQNQVCNILNKDNIKTTNKFLFNDGTIGTSEYFGITDYIKITKKGKINVINIGVNQYSPALCFYNSDKNLISCIKNSDLNLNQTLTIPNNANYVRFSIATNTNAPQFEVCNNGNQAISDQQQEIHNSITDSSTDDPSSDLNDMNSNEISNSVISDLLLLPLNMFQNIVNAIGGTCSSFPLGSLFGTNLVLPCINIENMIGSALWNTIDILFCGIFVLSIRKKFVDIFENITSLKDRGNELE